MTRIVAAALLLAALTQNVSAAQCGRRDAVIEALAKHFGESAMVDLRVSPGEEPPAVTLFVNPATGTWTVIATSMVPGLACISLAGKGGFTILKPAPVPAPGGPKTGA